MYPIVIEVANITLVAFDSDILRILLSTVINGLLAASIKIH